ncbi:class F sortase [Streptomyces sp. 142MFCol3.1]|uniref:class F sortase n=1 Tax=Streptomyces sp. 142MFCol3.1 TaxID=1172179 RepID=UPI0003F87BFA|nr:class F sortase [Streptomyces sp. 142MFCol3.1]
MTARSSSPTDNAEPGQGARAGRTLLTWSIGLLILALGLIGSHDPSAGASRGPHGSAALSPSVVAKAGKHLPRSAPTRLIIPKISVDAPFTALSIGPSGRLEPPPADDVNLVGWHAAGVSPGEPGTAIIAGHVDTKTSAAVFVGLGELEEGDHFEVERADGRTARFVVDSSETFEKDDFPDSVYADTPQAQVRLITCAGSYDHAAEDYTENLVVFAHLV